MSPTDPATQAWLESLLGRFEAVAGTVHHDRAGELHLTAAHNIPAPVVERMRVVPQGKGMAGLAQTRREPVQTCNLQQDDTGRIMPMAKLVGGQAAVAIPVLDAGAVRAVVGLTFAYEGDVPPDDVARMRDAAATVPADPSSATHAS